MFITSTLRRFAGFLLTGGLLAHAAHDAASAEFFENQIRPVLVERCYSCHSAKAEKLKGDLRLDTKAGVAKGGATGPLFVAGKPAESLLIQALKGTAKDLDAMPPKGDHLKPEQIAAFEAWVKMGAPDPREDVVVANPAATHWAFRKPVAPRIPEVPSSKLKVQNPIDQARPRY